MARGPRRAPQFRFQFLGWQAGWYVLRLTTARRPPLEVHAFQGRVFEWLIEQGITPNDKSYLANGNTGDGPVVPAMADGSALCLLLRRVEDVRRFAREFGCRDLNPETMWDAVDAAASVHRFALLDVGRIAYDAIRRLYLVFGDRFPEWDDQLADEQQFFLQRVREYMEHPDWSADRLHAAWMDRRQAEGWRYGPEADFERRQHPALVPFSKLLDRDQAVVRLIASAVASLLSLFQQTA
jgi:hypothetical protein